MIQKPVRQIYKACTKCHKEIDIAIHAWKIRANFRFVTKPIILYFVLVFDLGKHWVNIIQQWFFQLFQQYH